MKCNLSVELFGSEMFGPISIHIFLLKFKGDTTAHLDYFGIQINIYICIYLCMYYICTDLNLQVQNM